MNPRWLAGAAAAGLGLAVAAAYLPSARAGWAFDDQNLVRPSPALRDLGGLREAVSTDLYRQAAPRLEASPYWRPLALASYWLDTRLGAAPRALHLGNVLLHALAAALLAALLLRRLGPAGWVPALVAAAWWAFHPQNVEAVAWISCRYDLLCAVALLGLVALPWRPGILRAALHGLLFLAGLLSKDGFAVLALVVVAMDHEERRPPRAAAPRWIAVAAAVAAWLGLRAAVGIVSFDPPPPALVPGILWRYLDCVRLYAARAVVPPALTVDRPYLAGSPLELAAGGALVAALVAAALWRRRLAVPVVIFLAGLVPGALAVSRFGEVPERYLYLPSIGLAMLAGEGLAAGRTLRRPILRWAGPAAVGLLAVAGLVRVELRLPDWQDDAALFAAALRVDPASPQANMTLAVDAGHRGDWPAALRMLAVAQRASPASARIAGAHAWALLESGDFVGALGQAERATSLAPHEPNNWYYRARASHEIGDHAGELAAIERLLELSPDFPRARRARATAACEASGRTDCFTGARGP